MRGGGVVKVIVFSNYYFSHENISLSRVTSFSTCPLVHEKYSVSRREIYGLVAATGTSCIIMEHKLDTIRGPIQVHI